jgi:hypothetical protein
MVRSVRTAVIAASLMLGTMTGASATPGTSFTESFTLQNAAFNTSSSGHTNNAGTLTGYFVLRDISGTITLLSADLVENITAPTTTCPGGNQCNVYTKTFIYGLSSPTATLFASGSGADPFFELKQTVGTDTLTLEWVAGNLTIGGISSFLEPQSVAYAPTGNVYVESGNAIPEPGSLAAFSTGIVGLIGFGWRRAKRAVATSSAV